MRNHDLGRLIRESFASRPRPGLDRIVYDRTGAHLEGAEIQADFAPHTWAEVPLQVLVRHDSGLSFMTTEAFAYYLPAYLLAVVEHFDATDTLPENLVYYLTLPVEADSHFRASLAGGVNDAALDALIRSELEQANERVHRFVERAAWFDREQGRSIRSFLEHLADAHRSHFLHDEPSIAVYRYWFQYA